MIKRLNFTIRYFIFWVLLFSFFRLAFMLYQFELFKSIKLNELPHILVRGAWMDASLAGYILLLAYLMLTLLFHFQGNQLKKVFNTLTFILLTTVSIVVISDMELYRNWGFRIDATPLLYLKTPKEAMASQKTLSLILFIAIVVLVTLGAYITYKRFTNRTLAEAKPLKWFYLPVLLFLAAAMIIPIRGGFGIAPMNPGKVYFSQNAFCNHAALNPVWNMMYSVSKSSSMNKEYPVEIDKSFARQRFSQLMHTDSTLKVLNTNRPNILIILLESFGARMVKALGGLPDVTPNLNQLANEGLLFTRIAASGDRSDKGIIAILAGFPAQPTQSVIKYPTKANKLATLSGVLQDNGYTTTFYYGGDPDFANIRSFLYHAKFQRLITQDDFPKNFRNSKWGVHDEHVFNYLLNDLDSAKAPFFKMFFTLSSHEPFEIPAKPKFKGKSEAEQFLSSVYYTDSCLGHFINQAGTKEWFKNTLIILVADHGHRHPANLPNYEPLKFHIPMVWLGGALKEHNQTINTTCSQTDLAATLLAQLDIPHDAFPLSKNVLSKNTFPFAYMAFNEGFGFVTQTDTLVYDLVGRKYIKKTGVRIDRSTEDAWSFFSEYQKIFSEL